MSTSILFGRFCRQAMMALSPVPAKARRILHGWRGVLPNPDQSVLSMAPVDLRNKDVFQKYGYRVVPAVAGKEAGSLLVEALRSPSGEKPTMVVVGGQRLGFDDVRRMHALGIEVIVRQGTDTGAIERSECAEATAGPSKLKVDNTPYVNAPYVSDYIRKHLLEGAKPGDLFALIGYGPTHRHLTKSLLARGMRVCVYTPRLAKDAAESTLTADIMALAPQMQIATSLHHALRDAHGVSIAVNENSTSHGMFTPDVFEGLKPNGRVVCVSPFSVLHPTAINWLCVGAQSNRLASVVLDNNPEQVTKLKHDCQINARSVPSNMLIQSRAMLDDPQCVRDLNEATALVVATRLVEKVIANAHCWPGGDTRSSDEPIILIGDGFNNLVLAYMLTHSGYRNLTIIGNGLPDRTSRMGCMRHVSPAEHLMPPSMRIHGMTTSVAAGGCSGTGDRILSGTETAFVNASVHNGDHSALVALRNRFARAFNSASCALWERLMAHNPEVFAADVMHGEPILRVFLSEDDMHSVAQGSGVFGAQVTPASREHGSDTHRGILAALNPKAVKGGLAIAPGAIVRADKLYANVQKFLHSHGVTFITGTVQACHAQAENPSNVDAAISNAQVAPQKARAHVHLADGRVLHADRVVISTGAQDGGLLANSPAKPLHGLVQGVAGFFAHAEGLPNANFKINTPVQSPYLATGVVNINADPSGMPRVSAGFAFVGEQQSTPEAFIALQTQVVALLSHVVGKPVVLHNVEQCSANGGRPFSADGLDIMDVFGASGSVIFNGGTGAGGFTKAPLHALLLEQLWDQPPGQKGSPLHLPLAIALRVLATPDAVG